MPSNRQRDTKMTTPFVVGRPRGPQDLSAFYPEWAEPASGFELEKQLCRDSTASLADPDRGTGPRRLLQRIRRAWTRLWKQAGPRLPVFRRPTVDG